MWKKILVTTSTVGQALTLPRGSRVATKINQTILKTFSNEIKTDKYFYR